MTDKSIFLLTSGLVSVLSMKPNMTPAQMLEIVLKHLPPNLIDAISGNLEQ